MGCIYVVEGNLGIIKVGCTRNFKGRLYALKRDFKKFGDEVCRFFKGDELQRHESAESRLIGKLKGSFEQYYGKEWFTGSFDDAVQAAIIATEEARFYCYWECPVVTDEQREANRLGNIARKIKEKKDKADRHAAFRIAVDARKALRVKRREEIAARFSHLAPTESAA